MQNPSPLRVTAINGAVVGISSAVALPPKMFKKFCVQAQHASHADLDALRYVSRK